MVVRMWGMMMIIVLMIGYGAAQEHRSQSELKLVVHQKAGQQVQAKEQTHVQDQVQGKPSVMITLTAKHVYQGNLLLVNKDHPVRSEGVKSDVVTLAHHEELVRGYGLLDASIQASRSVMRPFLGMMAAADRDGVRHYQLNSGYRDAAKQDELYQLMGKDYALPAGYSEHNLGLSLDIGSTQEEMSRAPEGKWLKKHAWSYGFILRYPEDKTDITGIRYEPWHFRYVGLPHSVIMREKNLTLEEYLDYLRDNPALTATIKGAVYRVMYYPVREDRKVQVPLGADEQYELSGNNMDGVIVTVHP
ncbi:M15 family metallopeptidase [Paenibacillus sp. GCM10023252]|uniref:M15 family metallopeptidase n=1 Tax=Paenibacillus sp. GCM10023252 TaxID=3252649 RepID=UPI003A935E93